MLTTTAVANALKASLIGTYPDVDFVADSVDPDHAGPIVWITPVAGPGTDVDGLVQARGYDVDVAGKQFDFNYAEQLAFAVDRFMLGDGSSTVIGGTRVISRAYAGGVPYMTGRDDAERTHFVCGYLYEVDSGI